MNDFPFSEFLALLAADDITLSVRDCDRLLIVFQTGGRWTLPRLRNVLISLLAKDEDEQRLIARKFDGQFKTVADEDAPEIDIRRVLADLKKLKPAPMPAPPPPAPPTPKPVSQPPEPDRLLPVVIGILLLVSIAMAIFWKPEKTDTGTISIGTITIDKPEISLSQSSVGFGSLQTGKSAEEKVTIANPGKAPLIITEMRLDGKTPEAFEAVLPELPVTLHPNDASVSVTIIFRPQTAGAFEAALQLTHNAANRPDSILFTGIGVTPEKPPGPERPKERTRLYRNVPYVKSVTYEPLKRVEKWKIYVGISALLLILLVIHGLYLLRLKKGPEVRKPKVDPKAPMFFHSGDIGGKPEARLDEETLAYLADAMGYFQSGEAGNVLDVAASINATIKHGGIPTCAFMTRARIRTLLILEDAHAEVLDWNPVSGELAQGMKRYGVPVIYGTFSGSPAVFRTEDGHEHHLDDLEDQRRGILMLMFTDGKCFHRPRNAFVLEELAQWPMKAWMELRERRFWDDTLLLPLKHGIPVYPATRAGVVQAVRRFMTERGSHEQISRQAIAADPVPDRADMPLGVWMEYLLGDALPWAQACAMSQPIMPVSEGLADSLRHRFHPDLPPERIERLYALPNTTRTASGIRFADEVLRELRKGFLNRNDEAQQRAVLTFFLEHIEAADPKTAEDSLSHLSWEALRERLRLELGAEDELKRFAELMQTPLAGSLEDSLEHFGPPGRKDAIPLREAHRSRKALQRLERVPGNPLGITVKLPWMHKGAFGFLAVLLIASSFLAVYSYRQSSLLIQTIRISAPDEDLMRTPAVLETAENQAWVRVTTDRIVPGVDAIQKLGAFTKPEDRDYRLLLYGNGRRSLNPFSVKRDQVTLISLDRKNVAAPCEESDAETGLTTIRCPGLRQGQKEETPWEAESWKQRLADQVPDDREMSIGIGLSQTAAIAPEFRSLENRLLETRSIDLFYHIHPDGAGAWQIERALEQIRMDLAPWIATSQLVWGSTRQTPGISSEFMNRFQRAISLGSDINQTAAATIEKIFDPGETALVSEAEIKEVTRSEAVGNGAPIALIRPVVQRYALTVNTVPENATVKVTKVSLTAQAIAGEPVDYHAGVLLAPGRYDVNASRDGYETGKASVTIADRNETVEIRLSEIKAEPQVFALQVNTVPEDANIQLIGSEKPYQDGVLLKPGKYEIEATLDGYEPHREIIALTDADKQIDIQLKPVVEKYTLTVKTTPEDARVRIMNIRPKYEDGILLEPGRYDIEVTKDGYIDHREWVTLETKETTVEVTLAQKAPETPQAIISAEEAALEKQFDVNFLKGFIKDFINKNEERLLKALDNTDEKELAIQIVAEFKTDLKRSFESTISGLPADVFYENYTKDFAKRFIAKYSSEIEDEITKALMSLKQQKQMRASRASKEWTEPVTNMKFVWVPGGTFEMGCGGAWASECDTDEKPTHTVALDGFWMGKYEVTKGQFEQFVSETKYPGNGENWSHCSDMAAPLNMTQTHNHPVVCVSWEEASEFAQWLSEKTGRRFSLPTEAEWEFACRAGGKNTRYCGGEDIDVVAWYDGNSVASTLAVGQKKANAIGLHDMSGNAWEWCNDRKGTYSAGSVTNPTGPSSEAYRVLRGGAWSVSAWYCRAPARDYDWPRNRNADCGFRLVLPAGQ